MKVSLLITSGPHQGEAIPVTVSPFLIGRDASCHLRPATPVVSKKHCGIIQRDGKVFIVDYGSTNGTLVGDLVLRKSETEAEDGMTVRVARHGPLDMKLSIEQEAEVATESRLPQDISDAPPPFEVLPDEALAMPMRDRTQPVKLPPARVVPPAKPVPAGASDDDSESIAALLLRSDPGLDDPAQGGTMKIIGSPPSEEDDSDNLDDSENRAAEILHNAKAAEAPAKKALTPEEMANAANELLAKIRSGSKPPPGCRFLS